MKYNELVAKETLPDPDADDHEYCNDVYNDIYYCMRKANHQGVHADFYEDGPDIPQGFVRVAKVWGRATGVVV